MYVPTFWNEMDYTPDLPKSDTTMWDAEWSLESPAMGGRILAHDKRSTIVYAPNNSPYNESEQRLARLILHSREMLSMLKRAAIVIDVGNPYVATVEQIDALIARVEGK